MYKLFRGSYAMTWICSVDIYFAFWRVVIKKSWKIGKLIVDMDFEE
jgi:hypothetical protein